MNVLYYNSFDSMENEIGSAIIKRAIGYIASEYQESDIKIYLSCLNDSLSSLQKKQWDGNIYPYYSIEKEDIKELKNSDIIEMSYYSNSNSNMDSSTKGLIISGLVLVALLFVISCMNTSSINNDREKQNMIQIENSDNLVYEKDTLIVYREEIINGRYIDSVSYQVYYNSNGNKCKYIDNEIVEMKGE